MKKQELILLRKALQDELIRRDRINKLLDMDNVKEYLSLNNKNIEYENMDKSDVVKTISKDFTSLETNDIYVWTNAFFESCEVIYEETKLSIESLRKFGSALNEFKEYLDIENGKYCYAYINEEVVRRYITKKALLINDFEKNNIVLNPYNTSDNKNGYDEVRNDFLLYSIEYGQPKAKKLLLEKYPRI